MYKLSFLAAIALAATPSLAHAAGQKNGLCEVYAKAARTIMTVRQNNHPIEDTMRWYASDPASSAYTLMQALIQLAYLEHRFESKSFQQKAIDDFGNRQYMLCLNA